MQMLYGSEMLAESFQGYLRFDLPLSRIEMQVHCWSPILRIYSNIIEEMDL